MCATFVAAKSNRGKKAGKSRQYKQAEEKNMRLLDDGSTFENACIVSAHFWKYPAMNFRVVTSCGRVITINFLANKNQFVKLNCTLHIAYALQIGVVNLSATMEGTKNVSTRSRHKKKKFSFHCQ